MIHKKKCIKYFLLISIIYSFIFIQIIYSKLIIKENKTFIDSNTIIGGLKNNKKKLIHNCYIPQDFSKLKLVHFIITRFLIHLTTEADFKKNLYIDKYFLNGLRVMKKYLLPSLENQSCKDFIWIIMIGDKANITLVKSILNFNCSFHYKIIYKKDLNNYLKKSSKGFDVLITTRIDYDDKIYYDSVNDVRKAVNLDKPIILHGYNRGVYYYESIGNFYNHYRNNVGAMSIFLSLITVLKKINTTITIYDIGPHNRVEKYLMKRYKSYGIKELNYNPTVYDSGSYKYVWVRQKFSGSYNDTKNLKNKILINNTELIKYFF